MFYSTFLIDLDHTLFDSDASEASAFAQTMKAAGVSDPDKFVGRYQQINLELWAAVERGECTPQQVRNCRFERLVAETELDADPLVMADTFVSGLGAFGDLYDGARDAIQRLNEHASLALVTNGLSEVQRARIDRLGIEQYFDAVVISAEIGHAKPGSAIFDYAFEKLGFPAMETALMVGDSLSSDIRGGTNYGIATCWYNRLGRAATPVDTIGHEISELKELLSFVEMTERVSR